MSCLRLSEQDLIASVRGGEATQRRLQLGLFNLALTPVSAFASEVLHCFFKIFFILFFVQ